MKTALIVSTYNRPKALRVCLDSILWQHKLPDEVIIADDGSGEETLQLIKSYSKNFPIPLRHVWQEDKGFQLAKIRNKAIASTDADFIIQIDGDVVLHPYYIEDFLSVARKGYCILGSRVGLDLPLSTRIEDTRIIPKIRPWTKGIVQKPARSLYCKIGRYISYNYQKNKSIGYGCSMAFWRDDFIKVNGYDEDFVGWGCEDRDLILRMLNAGIPNHKLMLIGIVYHLWHNENDRSNHMENRKLCYGKSKEDIRCKKGIDQYLNSL